MINNVGVSLSPGNCCGVLGIIALFGVRFSLPSPATTATLQLPERATRQLPHIRPQMRRVLLHQCPVPHLSHSSAIISVPNPHELMCSLFIFP